MQNMKRIQSLDSLRGLAALTVLLDHCALIFPDRFTAKGPPWFGGEWVDPWSYAEFTPFKLLFCGDQAVLVFFALSGFVLAGTFKLADQWSYRSYIVKRAFRIYPPFAFAIFASAGMYIIAEPRPINGLSNWFNNVYWVHPLSLGRFIGHLAMTDRRSWQELDQCMWSLVQEFRISIVFPLLAVACRERPITAFLFSSTVSAVALACHHFIGPIMIVDPFATLQYLFLFAGGAVLALNPSPTKRFVRALPRMVKFVIWILVIALMTYPPNKHLGLFVCGGASILLVALCFADESVTHRLSGPIPVWLGRVSYSLYLLHAPILMFVVHVFYGHAPLYVLVAITIASSLAASELSYRFVEIPAIELGRRLATRTRSTSRLA